MQRHFVRRSKFSLVVFYYKISNIPVKRIRLLAILAAFATIKSLFSVFRPAWAET